ncbi:hypothetical protein Dimus_000986 [Dionaea muscipula]
MRLQLRGNLGQERSSMMLRMRIQALQKNNKRLQQQLHTIQLDEREQGNDLTSRDHVEPCMNLVVLDSFVVPGKVQSYFFGRQVHPLFSQWKVGKSNPKNYDPESNCGMTIAKDKHFKFGPIDVLEDIKMASVGLAPTSALRESSGHGVDKLPQEMSDMKVREDKDMEPAIVDGNGMETEPYYSDHDIGGRCGDRRRLNA